MAWSLHIIRSDLQRRSVVIRFFADLSAMMALAGLPVKAALPVHAAQVGPHA